MGTTTKLKPDFSNMTAAEIADMLEHGFKGIENVAPVMRRAISLLRRFAAQAEPSKAGDERIESAAQLLWDRFAPSHHVEWSEEPHKAEYRDAARALLSAPAQAQSEDARDAARYRWLRDHEKFASVRIDFLPMDQETRSSKYLQHRVCWHVEDAGWIDEAGDGLDAAIDAAMRRHAAMSTQSEKE